MRKYIIILVGLLTALIVLAIFSLPDKNLHLVFCDVGQGDAILVTLGTNQILIDGGPDSRVLSCLGRHLPFWERKIEVVLLTHPQEDHFGGLVDVVRRYNVGVFVYPGVEGTAAGWQVLKEELNKRKIAQQTLGTGNKIRYSSLYFDIFHPSTRPPAGGLRSGQAPRDLNEYSVVGKLSFGEFDALLTGDIPTHIADQLALSPELSRRIEGVEVLKVPHHGSKNGLTAQLLDKSSPKLAVISAGKDNWYGHPHEEVIRLLGNWGIRILRTDLDGEIEIVSDGKFWWVR